MAILVLFAFIAGVVTILSPCILPILPIILSSSVSSDTESRSKTDKKPYGIVVGFILSFTFFTLFLSSIVKVTGVSADALRFISIIIIAGFGISLISPKIQVAIEKAFSKLAHLAPKSKNRSGFGGGLLLGLSLGLLWTPCVGPILASVISLALIGEVSSSAILVTFVYALGTAIPMLLIIKGGNTALQKVPWLTKNSRDIQKTFGVIMIITAILIFYKIDRKFQSYILTTFPRYGVGLTAIEDNDMVDKELQKLQEGYEDEVTITTTDTLLYDKQGLAPKILSEGPWINSAPLTLEELKGKVVLIDFWTYTCINCQRTFPYLRTWYEKYEKDGLVIIGVHAPEFEFEKKLANVVEASEDFELSYPIVLDNEFKTWRNYKNRYWPAKYLIDEDGYIRYTHFGEGSYDETEKVIQLLLNETGMEITNEINNPSYKNFAKTPELYLGYARMEGFSSNETLKPDEIAPYTRPDTLGKNKLAFEGEWLSSAEFSSPKAGSKLFLNFESKDVFLVMNTKAESSTVKVYLDGKYYKDILVEKDALYTVIEMEIPGRHLLELKFEDGSVEVFAFTFG